MARRPSTVLLTFLTIDTSHWVQEGTGEGLEGGARTPLRKARTHLKMPPSECNIEQSDFGDGPSCWDSFLESEEEDREEQEEETEVGCPLVDEWEAVLAHLEPKASMALALTSVRTLCVVGIVMMKSEGTELHIRQDMIECMGRSLRRGLFAGSEAMLASALTALLGADEHPQVRWVAAAQIGYILRLSTVRHAAVDRAAYTAMLACVGDDGAVAMRIAAERDPSVRTHMERWAPRNPPWWAAPS